jgi:hypothetical protein
LTTVVAWRGGLAQVRGASREPSWYSVQMHVHGSFSEGLGSIDSHSYEASELGVDAIWWSDHDWRIASYRHCASFGFDDFMEPLDRHEAWSRRAPSEFARDDKLSAVNQERIHRRPWAQIRARGALEGKGCLEVNTRRSGTPVEQRPDGFRPFTVELLAPRDRFVRPLASGLTVRLGVLPRDTGPAGRVVVEIQLSEHAPRGGGGLETYSLRYVLDNAAGEPVTEGATRTIPVPYVEGEWNRLEFPVTRDAVAGFPFLVGEDNSLAETWEPWSHHATTVGSEIRAMAYPCRALLISARRAAGRGRASGPSRAS